MLLLTTLVNEAVSPEVRSIVVTGLEPRDMYQVEYMMILDAAQRLHQAGKPIDLAALNAELEPMDPAAFARIVLASVHEDRLAGPTSAEDVHELVSFLVELRSQH